MITVSNDKELAIVIWLSCVKNFNGSLGIRLLDYFGNAEECFNATDAHLKSILPPRAYGAFIEARKHPPEEIMEDMLKKDIKFTSCFSDDFPKKLKNIPDAPLGLFYKGVLPENSIPAVAIIGARECSEYGAHIARELGSYLGKSGIYVISGMARGTDGISQAAAVAAGGQSFGVLGSGVDVCYPRENRSLYNSLTEAGGILSTYAPGEPAIAANFPPRNRIVSGLSDAVVVIEARQKSGTLITVDMALEQGRDVYAVPGRIIDRLSDGCNGLIGQGANVFLSPEIFLTELLGSIESKRISSENSVIDDMGNVEDNISEVGTITRQTNPPGSDNKISKLHRHFEGEGKIPPGLTEEQQPVYLLLDIIPKSVEEINSKLPEEYDYSYTSMILMQLVLDGYANQISQSSFSKKLI